MNLPLLRRRKTGPLVLRTAVDLVRKVMQWPVFVRQAMDPGYPWLCHGSVRLLKRVLTSDMTGFECNDQMRNENGKVVFDSNNAGGITGGLTTGQTVVARLAVKPTPTIDRPQHTVDKYTLEDKDLAAITRRDPTIVARIWPVAEAYTAITILDHLMMHYGYQEIMKKIAD